MIDQIAAARDAALAEIDRADSLDSVTALDSRLLGKKGALAQLKTQLGGLATVDEKRTAGQAVNEAMEKVAEAIAARTTQLGNAATAARVAAERLDLTEFAGKPVARPRPPRDPGLGAARGRVRRARLPDRRGPEVETDWHNFEALNMGEDIRPAASATRCSSTTAPGGSPAARVLRTHTSPVQIRTMLTQPPPIYIVAPGRVFRRDTPDATHMPVFHQIEGLVVDRDITLADLAGTIEAFTKAFFGAELHIPAAALRTSRSPSPRPSSTSSAPTARGSSSAAAAWCTRTCCVPAASIPSSGAASRSASASTAWPVMRHQIADIRDMFANDLRFVEQF